ncbi:MAG: hypothetical protein CMG21_02780 [Candidatus Marinimicrobia bacterium]|nr:hypothetical protein [Candidatus Neomarinimicrobiota bacterium]
MLKAKNNIFFVRLFIYSFSFFLFVFLVLLLKFNQISRDIDSDRIHPDSIFYGLPSIELLRDYQPKELSKIISSDNKVLYEFYDFDSNRDVVDIDIIPQYTIDALIANEDKNFFNHYGIHIPSIFRSFYINFITKKRAQGGSTVSMQLARNLYDTKLKQIGHEKTISRKIKEIILAIKIEQVYTKTEILEMYLNSVYFGNIKGRPMWGIQKASKIIFGKEINQLQLHESSLLIALLPAPNDRIPFRHPINAKKYRDLVLLNLFNQNFINENDYKLAVSMELPQEPFLDKRQVTPYYVQYVEEELKKINNINYKNGGLIIHTTFDSRIQNFLETSFNEIILNSKRGLQNQFNKAILNTEDAYNDRLKDICSYIENDRIGVFNDSIYIDINREIRLLSSYNEDVNFSNKISTLKKRRITIRDSLRQECFSDVKQSLRNDSIPIDLRSKLLVQGAAIIFDIKTGSVLGMLGGRLEDQYHDYFNRATKAKRQPGSIFKPFVYLTAIKDGHSPYTKLKNQAIKIWDKSEFWEPENWNNEVGGIYTLRQGLYGSVNLIAVRVLRDLEVSPFSVKNTAINFKFTTDMNPVPSIALGSSEVKPIEIISAYSTVANLGTHLQPIVINKIMDSDGKLIKSFLPEPEVVDSEAASYILLDMMRDVVDEYKFKYQDENNNGKYDNGEHVYSRGTGHKLRTKYNFGFDYEDYNGDGIFNYNRQNEINSSKITIPCAGKTGTTNSQTDAWFIGFTPEISMGVWIGMDDKRISLGKNLYGSSAALPIFANTMNKIYDLGNYNLNNNNYTLISNNDSWDYIPEGVIKIKVCEDEKGNLCKANKYCRDSYEALFLKEFIPLECVDN